MKSTEYIKEEMESLRPFTVVKSEKKKYDELKTCLYYLQTNPSEELLIKQLQYGEKLLTVLNNRLEMWIRSNTSQFRDEKEAIRHYKTSHEIPKYEAQIKTLKFLLD